MGKSAYIKLVENSTRQELSLEDLKQELERYVQMTSHTGEQLDWNYAEAAFPYTLEERSENGSRWVLLKGKDPKLYKYLIMGISSEGKEIQVVLPDGATHGDQAKANEFCRYLAKAFQGELHMFNGRIMYFYPRKL